MIGFESHHVWLENRSDFVIYLPYFLHKLHSHTHENKGTMDSVNSIALDYWINEELYSTLYCDEVVKKTCSNKLKRCNIPKIDYKSTTQAQLESYSLL